MSLPLADSGIEERGFVARVGSHEQQQVTVLDADDARVQQVVGAQVSAAGRERKKQCQLMKLETYCIINPVHYTLHISLTLPPP